MCTDSIVGQIAEHLFPFSPTTVVTECGHADVVAGGSGGRLEGHHDAALCVWVANGLACGCAVGFCPLVGSAGYTVPTYCVGEGLALAYEVLRRAAHCARSTDPVACAGARGRLVLVCRTCCAAGRANAVGSDGACACFVERILAWCVTSSADSIGVGGALRNLGSFGWACGTLAVDGVAVRCTWADHIVALRRRRARLADLVGSRSARLGLVIARSALCAARGTNRVAAF